jgi:excisionase family DNA binding protein
MTIPPVWASVIHPACVCAWTPDVDDVGFHTCTESTAPVSFMDGPGGRRGAMEGLPELLTPREVATWLRVSERTVTRWIVAGLLPAWKTPGRVYRIRRSDIERFGERNTDETHG